MLTLQKQIPHVVLHPFGMTYLARRNPWVPVWWSVALPGFGHLRLGQHVKGILLMIGEIVINNMANLNLAIFHTLLGETDQAMAVLNRDWLFLYPVFYLFTMFDSYRICVDLNQMCALERRQPTRKFDRISATLLGVNMLVRRRPILAAIWSGIAPGFGQLYCDRGLKALVLIGWYVAVVIKSGLVHAVNHTLLGEFSEVLPALDWEWMLFWPSIYLFGIADAYQDCVEQNTVADEAFQYRMRKYLRNSGPLPKN